MADPHTGPPPGADALPLQTSSLRRFAQRAREAATESEERCELCSQPIPARHRHLLELVSRELVCVCRPCSILFDKRTASLGQYVLVPERRLFLEEFRLGDDVWASLRLPVGLAFFVESSARDRVVAYYPSPLGPMESALRLDAWQQIAADNPVLQEMTQDVEALLVNRSQGQRLAAPGDHFLVPISDCYRLSGILRRHWRGINGGDEVWQKIEDFFEELQIACD